MARTGRRVPAMTEEQLAAVEAALRRRGLAPRLGERPEMVKAAGPGQDRAAIARWSGRSAGTVRSWLRRFTAGGVEALADAPRAGRPARADAAYRRAAEAALETPPRAFGLPFDVWTSARLSAYPAETTGVRIAPGWLHVIRLAKYSPELNPEEREWRVPKRAPYRKNKDRDLPAAA